MDATLTALDARFQENPSDTAAFEALEEAHFLAGEWPALVALYERRLESPELSPEHRAGARARVVLRLAQVQEERCRNLDAAQTGYEEAVELDPGHRPALVQLRGLYATRERWDRYLALTQQEADLPMRPFERAAFFTEVGDVWLRKLGDAQQAVAQFELALEADDGHVEALLGLADSHEKLHAPEQAALALGRAIDKLRGTDRAPALASLGRLYASSLDQPERAIEAFEHALADDPHCPGALEALAEKARNDSDWDTFEEYQERLFQATHHDVQRLAIVHEAGRVHLEEHQDAEAARHWFQRALELFPDDPVVHLYMADIERTAGNADALADHLQQATHLADDAAPTDLLQESAHLALEGGDDDFAIEQLHRALEKDPSDAAVRADLLAALEDNGRENELTSFLEREARTAERGSTAAVEALLRLGRHHRERRGDDEAARGAFVRAFEADPTSEGASLALQQVLTASEDWSGLRDLHQRIADCEQATSAQRTEAFCQLGDLAIARFEDLTGAQEAFRKALDVDEECSRAREGIERIAMTLGDDDALLEAFEREAQVTTDRERLGFLCFELARIFEEREDAERALHWMDHLAQASPEDVRALEDTARLREALGRHDELRETLQRLDPLLSGEAQTKNRRRQAALCIDLGDDEGARSALRSVLESQPDDVEALRQLDKLLDGDARRDERVDVHRHLATLLRGDERLDVLESLGHLQAARGDLPSALDAWIEVLEGDAGDETLALEVEDGLRTLGRHAELCARLSLRREGMDPLDPEAFELDVARAELLLDRLDQPEAAIELFDLAREADPRSERARDGLERALRRADRGARLAELLAEKADEEADAERRAQLTLERATLLEESLEQLPEAKTVLAELAGGDSALASDAETRLRALLERTGDWHAIRERLAAQLGDDADADVSLHLELADLSIERLDDRDAAIHHLERAVELDATRTSVWQRLASLYDDAGDEGQLFRALEGELATEVDEDRAALLHARAAELAAGPLEAEADAERHFSALLQFDGTHTRAVEFLAERYTAEDRHEPLAALWKTQLQAISDEDRQRGADASLRLRIAALEAGPLDDLDAAIATLEPAADCEAALLVIAEPLADLYDRAGRAEQGLALARRVVAACDVPEERAGWNLRVADALRRNEDYGPAAEAYRQTLVDRPEDRGAQSALRDLYRRLGEPAPLVRLLEAELARVGGAAEVPFRMELAQLLAGPLDRAGDALVHLRRVLQLEPGHGAALEQALLVSQAAERHDETLEWLSLSIERTQSPRAKAELLATRGALEGDVLARPDAALASFEAALDLEPHDDVLAARVRSLQEQAGNWDGALSSLERQLANCLDSDRDGQLALLEEGVALAEQHLGAEAALPWLVRLRALSPGEPALLQRLAALHRQGGRHEALLRTLEEEIATGPDPERRATLECERARLFEQELSAPGRALAALEAARTAAPGSVEVLGDLERLYADAGRLRERADVLAALIDRTEGTTRLGHRRAAAETWTALGAPETSLGLLWDALPDAPEGLQRVELLRELETLFPKVGRRDLWARMAEAELAALDPDAPVFDERRRELHWVLADAYRAELGRPDRAEAHLRALLDDEGCKDDAGRLAAAEASLFDLLRSSGDAIELETRLSRHLEEAAPPSEEDREARGAQWLELARLRHERLHRIGRAAEAFERAREFLPEDLGALRGLRTTSERLGRHAVVADCLDCELELRSDASPAERAALYRTLGEITWRRLDHTTRASSAFAAGLEADPNDRVCLRSLQTLFETMEDWRGAADLYESEVSILDDDETEARQKAWLRVGVLARDHLDDVARAASAYDAAAEIAPLAAAPLREHAELLEASGQRDRFVDVFARWLDDDEARARVADHLRHAESLEALDRAEEALERVEQAIEVESENFEAWDAAARLNLHLKRDQAAADAYERAAGCTRGGNSARRRLAAARLVSSSEDRVRLLDRAVADDPALAEAHARLAIAAAGLQQNAQAERAALRTLELAPSGQIDQELVRDAALAGGRAAWALDHSAPALGLFDAVLAIDPDQTEALAGHGRVALALGDSALARPTLERLLAQNGSHPDRAEHLGWLGRALQADGDEAQALDRFREALAIDPRLDDAHRGLTELLEKEGQIDEAVDALQTWAARAKDPNVRAGRLMHAARLELDRPGREEPAEALLREAVSTRPDDAIAWTLLCNLLWGQGRATEALDQATRAVDALQSGIEIAPCALIRGRALEQRGDHRAAADAFRQASDADPRCAEGALSAARLLRALGEWRESAEALQQFVDRCPEDARDQLAPAWHQLGRLLAGPLEDVDGAIEVYRRALETDPELADASHALADLLVHRPDLWDEAVDHHKLLLAENPVRLASLRGLLAISRGREQSRGVDIALAILRALGCATPEERVEAPPRIALARDDAPTLDGAGEILRKVAVEMAPEIGEALGVGGAAENREEPAGRDAVTRLRSALIKAEGELSAPALVPLTNDEVGSVLTLAAQLTLEVEAVHGDGDLVNGLSRALGRRARRRLKKTLEWVTPSDLAEIDWDVWRLDLRAYAALQALDSIGGELRTAFLAWLEAADGEEARTLPPESDLSDRIADNPQARVLLERLIAQWLRCL